MVGLKVKTGDGVYPFDAASKVLAINIGGTALYLASLEEWRDAHIAMNRKDQASLIEKSITE